MRCYSPELVSAAVEPYGPIQDFNPVEWLADHKNIALMNRDDCALFEYEAPGVYTGHYFFVSRGKEAIRVGKEFLREIFQGGHGVQVIRGLTPLTNLGARWMNKRLGFTGYGPIDTPTGVVELVILTKKEYLNG